MLQGLVGQSFCAQAVIITVGSNMDSLGCCGDQLAVFVLNFAGLDADEAGRGVFCRSSKFAELAATDGNGGGTGQAGSVHRLTVLVIQPQLTDCAVTLQYQCALSGEVHIGCSCAGGANVGGYTVKGQISIIGSSIEVAALVSSVAVDKRAADGSGAVIGISAGGGAAADGHIAAVGCVTAGDGIAAADVCNRRTVQTQIAAKRGRSAVDHGATGQIHIAVGMHIAAGRIGGTVFDRTAGLGKGGEHLILAVYIVDIGHIKTDIAALVNRMTAVNCTAGHGHCAADLNRTAVGCVTAGDGTAA